jgi:hypothetical protein
VEITFNTLHLSAFAVLTASPALPSARVTTTAQAPAAASPLVATICPQPHQVQAWAPALESIMTPAGGAPSNYPNQVSKRITKLDGFRGIPPRGRPKV